MTRRSSSLFAAAMVALSLIAIAAWAVPAAALAQDDPADPGMEIPDKPDDPDAPDAQPADPGTTDPGDPEPGTPGFDERPPEMDQPRGNGNGNGETAPDTGNGNTNTGTGDGAAAEKKQPEFKLAGHAYFGWAIDFNSTTGTANQFFVSTAYISIDAILNEQFSARFAIEMSDPTNALQSGFLNGLFVKDLYVRITKVIVEDSELRIGVHPSMWIELEQSWWDYRFVSRSIVEQQNIQQPNDFGISYKAWIRDSEESENQFWFKVGLFNGGGQQAVYDDLPGTITDVWKTPGAEFAWFNKGANLMIAAGWILNAGPSSTFDGLGSRFFFGLRIGDTEKQGFVAAISAYIAIDRNFGFQPGDALGLSVWGAIAGSAVDAELKDFGLMLRFDLFDPNTNSTTTDLQITILAGVYWHIAEFMRLYTGYRKTQNLDLSASVEDVFGVWADFHF
ncbi:MAG: hypothetical protein AB7K09_21030 [Planctomycetota bacterium]